MVSERPAPLCLYACLDQVSTTTACTPVARQGFNASWHPPACLSASKLACKYALLGLKAKGRPASFPGRVTAEACQPACLHACLLVCLPVCFQACTLTCL